MKKVSIEISETRIKRSQALFDEWQRLVAEKEVNMEKAIKLIDSLDEKYWKCWEEVRKAQAMLTPPTATPNQIKRLWEAQAELKAIEDKRYFDWSGWDMKIMEAAGALSQFNKLEIQECRDNIRFELDALPKKKDRKLIEELRSPTSEFKHFKVWTNVRQVDEAVKLLSDAMAAVRDFDKKPLSELKTYMGDLDKKILDIDVLQGEVLEDLTQDKWKELKDSISEALSLPDEVQIIIGSEADGFWDKKTGQRIEIIRPSK